MTLDVKIATAGWQEENIIVNRYSPQKKTRIRYEGIHARQIKERKKIY